MRTNRKNSALENERLKRKLRVTKKALDVVTDHLIELEKTFEIRFFEALDSLRKDYGTFLDPKPERIPISKSEAYDIRLMDILWIESDGRLKKIYLKRKIRNTEGKHLSDRITLNDDKITFQTLLPLLDKLGNHLVQVNRTYVINVAYFSLEGKILELKIKSLISHTKPTISLSKSFLKPYKTMKERFLYFLSFHKKLTRSN